MTIRKDNDMIRKDNDMKEQIFRYFRGELDDAGKRALDAWVGESEENARIFRDAGIEYEMLVMQTDTKLLRAADSGDAWTGDADSMDVWRIESDGRRRRIGTPARIFMGAAAAVVFFVLGVWAAHIGSERALSEERLTVSVPCGQRMTLTLADGTAVDLNAGSRLTYPAVFRGKERKVELEGEALFRVAHDEKKPFTVSTFAADIKVLGTDFNVFSDEEAGEFSTTLLKGKVSVTSRIDPQQSIVMAPDQMVILNGGNLQMKETEASGSVLWTEGIIDIADVSFDALMRRMERAYGVDIVIMRQDMPEIDCTSGQLRISDGIDHAMRVLGLLADFSYSKDPRTGTIYIR